MKHWSKFLPMAAAALSGCAGGQHSPLRLATGASAQTLCNAAFVSRLDPAQTLRDQLHPEPGMALIDWALRYRIDRDDRSVQASVFGGSHARAVFREGRGCTLVFGAGPQPAAFAPVPRPVTRLAEIAGPEVVVPVDPRLSAAIDTAFAEPGKGSPRSTQAIVIVHRGRVIGERYAPGLTVRTPLDSHSLAKSIMNALVGILVRDGKLALDRPFALPGDAGEVPSDGRTTIANLLRMNAGFGFDEGGGASVSSHIWYEEADTAKASMASVARSRRSDGWAIAIAAIRSCPESSATRSAAAPTDCATLRSPSCSARLACAMSSPNSIRPGRSWVPMRSSPARATLPGSGSST